MNKSKIALSLVTLGIIIPATAIAGNINVNTGKVRAVSQSNGNIYINTGQTSVSVPSRRRTWYPWRYWRNPWRSNCRHSNYQSTTQTTSSSGKVVRQSSVSSYCR